MVSMETFCTMHTHADIKRHVHAHAHTYTAPYHTTHTYTTPYHTTHTHKQAKRAKRKTDMVRDILAIRQVADSS